ncbi:hypothetical protein FRC01_009566, partial [Tulasnella sp. 417]
GDDELAPSANPPTAGPSNAAGSSHLSPLPPSTADSRPISTGSDDILSQISSYAFPLPPADNKRELLGANANQSLRVRFANQEKPPPNFKVSLHITEEQTLEDMLFSTGLLTGPRGERRRGSKEKDEPASATSSANSRDLPPIQRGRSASIPNQPGPSNDARSGSVANVPTFRRAHVPKPIRTNTTPAFLPRIAVEGGPEPVAPSASTSASTSAHASPNDGNPLKSSPGETASSAKADSASALAPTPERKGSSSATTPSEDAETSAGGSGASSARKVHSRNSKPQPPLPDTSPYQSPTLPSLLAPIMGEAFAEQPSRPPRQPKPQSNPAVIRTPGGAPIIPAAPGIASMVANALNRQSTISTATSFLPSSSGPTPAILSIPLPSAFEMPQPSVQSPDSSEGRNSTATDLPFSPNFLIPFAPREGQTRVDSVMLLGDSMRVDSATLPTEFPIHSPPSTGNQLGVAGSAGVSRNGSRSGSVRSPPQIVIPVLYHSSSSAGPSPRTPHTGSSVATAASGRHESSVPINRPRQGSAESVASSERSIRSDKGKEKEGSTSAKSPRAALPAQPTLSIVREDALVPPTLPFAEPGPSFGKVVSHSPSLPSLKNPPPKGTSHHLRNSPSLPNGSSVFAPPPQGKMESLLESSRDPATSALRNSFSKPPRPAPVPNISVAPASSVTNPSSSGSAGPPVVSVAPLRLTKPPPSAIPPATSAYLKRRERSASDSSPLSPRANLQRSSSVSEVPSPTSTAGSLPGSQAPSSFGAAFSRAFVGLKRKKSDQSMKGRDRDSDREDPDKRNKPVPAPIISVAPTQTTTDTRRNTASQFPQTPRPFSITSSGDQHVMTTVVRPTLTIPPTVKISEAGAPKLSPVQATPVPSSATSMMPPPSAFKSQTEK